MLVRFSRLPVAIAFLLLVRVPAAAQATLTLEIPPLTLTNTSVVNFAVIPNEQMPQADDLKTAVSADTENGLYRIRVPVRTVLWSDACLCFGYTVVVERATAAGSAGTQAFDVRGTPRGIFNEQVADVPLRIREGSRVESGVISLPVASYRSESPALVLDGPPTRDVGLSGGQLIEVKVRNTSDRFPVVATLTSGHSEVDPAPDDLFQGTPALDVPSGGQLTIKPGEASPIRIAVTPKTLNAIQRSIPPIGPDASHTNLTVKFDYQVGPFAGDRVNFFSQEIDIRFEPSFISLLLALFGGSLLGVAIRSLSEHEWKLGQFLRALGTSFLVALVIDVVAMLVASGGSKLVLFSYAIDPSQLLPTAAIGIFCGINGYRSAQWVVQRFKPEASEDHPKTVGV